MSIATSSADPRLIDFQVTDEEIIAHLADGRTISVPSLGRGDYRRLPKSNGMTSKFSVTDKEFLRRQNSVGLYKHLSSRDFSPTTKSHLYRRTFVRKSVTH